MKLGPCEEVGRVSRWLRRHGYVKPEEITLMDLAMIHALYDIRLDMKVVPMWVEPWHLEVTCGVCGFDKDNCPVWGSLVPVPPVKTWVRRYGKDGEFVKRVPVDSGRLRDSSIRSL